MSSCNSDRERLNQPRCKTLSSGWNSGRFQIPPSEYRYSQSRPGQFANAKITNCHDLWPWTKSLRQAPTRLLLLIKWNVIVVQWPSEKDRQRFDVDCNIKIVIPFFSSLLLCPATCGHFNLVLGVSENHAAVPTLYPKVMKYFAQWNYHAELIRELI